MSYHVKCFNSSSLRDRCILCGEVLGLAHCQTINFGLANEPQTCHRTRSTRLQAPAIRPVNGGGRGTRKLSDDNALAGRAG